MFLRHDLELAQLFIVVIACDNKNAKSVRMTKTQKIYKNTVIELPNTGSDTRVPNAQTTLAFTMK